MTDISHQISVLARLLKQRNFFLSTVESCTGGLIGHLLTNEPGSSDWYLGGVVAYSNTLKTRILGVEEEIINKHGAVSSQCVLSLAQGVLKLTGSQVSVAVSGIAGPGGGTVEKPVGTVYIGWCALGDTWWEKNVFFGDRLKIKSQSVKKALQGLIEKIAKV